MSPKNNYKFYQLIEWGVAIAACGWLVWKLATYEDYAALGECLRGMGWQQWLAIGVCVALMPVNMALEAWRWHFLWNDGMSREQSSLNEPLALNGGNISWKEAHRQVYYSKLAGLITPWRLGEYPSRAILMAREMENGQWTMDNGERTMENGKWKMENEKWTMENGERIMVNGEWKMDNDKALWAKVLSMGAVGSATMTAAIVLAGLVGIAFSPSVLELLGGSYLYAVGAVILGTVVLGGLGWYYGRRTLALTVGSPSVDRRGFIDLFIKSVGQSLVRLLCWCVQLALVVWALGGIGGIETIGGIGTLGAIGEIGIIGILSKCAVYYLLVTVTPNVPIVEVGVRGAWAVVVFGTMNAALAGVILWAINTLLPCLAWFFIRKKQK